MSKEFEAYLRENGIAKELTVPFTPQQNGLAERLNRTLIEKARAMLQAAELAEKYWGEAVMTAIYLKSRSPT